MTFITDIDAPKARLLFLLAGLGIYGVFGAPTPDHPGLAEIFVALALIVSAGFSSAFAALTIDLRAPAWRGAGQILLLYGLTVPLLGGVARGHDALHILRDVIPFLFLVLPVFLTPLITMRPAYFRPLLIGVLAVGFLFGLRAFSEIYTWVLSALFAPQGDEPAYFANAPTVLFTVLFLIGSGGRRFLMMPTGRHFLVFVLQALVALVAFLPIAMTLQRASVGYAGFYISVLCALALFYYPRSGWLLLIATLLALLAFYSSLAGLTDVLAKKTELVGFNMRFEEMAAAWREISGSWLKVIFGTGWGGTFESPAVGGVRVNYTHSLMTSVLLKTGITGVVLVVFYIYGLGRALLSFLRIDPVLALALAGPVIIDVFLYASFKSFDFGLVLLLITAFAESKRNIASEAQSLY